MKETVNFNKFCDAFVDMNRNNNFSYKGKRALFDYLEELEEDTGEEIELDVIALCCDYTESTWEELKKAYDIPEDEDMVAYLEENTSIIYHDNEMVLYLDF